MLLRKRCLVARAAALCALRVPERTISSTGNNNKINNNGEKSSAFSGDTTAFGDGDASHSGSAAPPPPSAAAAIPPPSSTGFQGWKRFDLSRSDDLDSAPSQPTRTSETSPASPTPAPAVHPADAAVDRKQESREARRRAASARLADMFLESGHHEQWLQSQQSIAPQARYYEEGVAEVRRVAQPSAVSSSSAVAGSPMRNYAYDEDEDAAAVTALAPATPTEVLEQELLDDNFFYYPAPAPLHPEDAAAAATPRAAAERYVPGQQIIPPGLTRYRVDVQYQGGDFDGWYKSVQRTRPSSTHASPMAEGSSRHFARTVLEEALAVALDVAAVSVVAAAIPEVGVSVRRLTCHVDVPSEVELQPRTILQRATLWLHQRRQPLAILSCHPCANQDFHARHSGVRRVYCYRILNRIAPPLFDAGLQWHVDRFLDVPRMQRMAAMMEGTHDYGYFADPKMANALRRAAAAHTGGAAGGAGQVVTAAYSPEHEPLVSHGLPAGQVPAAPKVAVERGLSQLERAAALPTFNKYGQRVVTYQAKPQEYVKARTNLPTVRTIDKIDVVRQEDEVLIWFVGQSFLRHQIRNMVSVLKAGGHGLWDEQELQHAFQSGFEVSRKKFARERLPPAPVHGLTLWDVEYPAQHRSDFVSYVDAGPYEPLDVSTQL